ncbi:MAG: DUF3050 domain-containing protein [Cyclobacteriaceae bacterium]
MANFQIKRIKEGLFPLRDQLVKHPLYARIKTTEQLHIFMEHHVYAVWDFMSLLKFLQQQLTCTTLPWMPVKDTATARMINEIVWGEESDVDRDGQPASHFELYHRAMQQAGADTQHIDALLRLIRQGEKPAQAAKKLALPDAVRDFLDFTFKTIKRGKLHEVAAVFTWGREDLIPDMFTSIVKDINRQDGASLEDFIYYLERHIEVDSGEHGPLALQMVENLCGDDLQKWNDCFKISQKALKTRLSLWDAILVDIKK